MLFISKNVLLEIGHSQYHFVGSFYKELFMGVGRMALLWILGVPLVVIVILKLLGII